MIRMTKAIATTAKQPKVPRAAVRATDGLSLSWISTTSCWVTGSIFVTRVCFFLEEKCREDDEYQCKQADDYYDHDDVMSMV